MLIVAARCRAAAFLLGRRSMNRKMILGDPPVIHLTHDDIARLEALLGGLSTTSRVAAFLRREVDRAIAVPKDEAASLVRLGSCVSFEDETGKLYSGKVGFPIDIADHPEPISVLTPVGAALLGLAEGQAISYETPDGRTKRLTILRVQPAS
jgi:regulator of nucleoside diphosphate kinase